MAKTFSEWQAKYEQTVPRRRTWIRYAATLDVMCEFFNNAEPKDIFSVDVADFRDWRLKTCKPRTVVIDLSVGSAFFSYLQERGAVEYSHNPFKTVRKPRCPEPTHKWMEEEKINKIRAQAKTPFQRLVLGLFMSTPLDGLTAASLEKKHFDFARKVIVIQRQKSGKSWVIPVRQDLLDMVAALPDGPLFPGTEKHRNPAYSLQECFRKMAVAAIGTSPGIHAFRHTYATNAHRAGVDLRTLQEVMGHRNMTTTAMYLTPSDTSLVRGFLETLPPLPSPD